MNDLQVSPSTPIAPSAPKRWKLPFQPYNIEGKTVRINSVERLIIDTWIDTLSVKECLLRLKEEYPGWKNLSRKTITKRLNDPRIDAVVTDRLRDRAIANGLTEDKWKAIGLLAMVGDSKGFAEMVNGILYAAGTAPTAVAPLSKMTHNYWEKLGRSFGYMKEGPVGGGSNNFQVNFIQKNGEA